MKRRINRFLSKIWRFLNRLRYPQLQGDRHSITVISANCIGGIAMKSLNMAFHTPTINLYITMPDFVRFCANLAYYLREEVQEDLEESQKENMLVCRLGDIRLYCVHYATFEQFQKAWNRRVARVHLDNIFLVMTDRDGFTEELLPQIAQLPYQKVLFSHNAYPSYPFVKQVKRYENMGQVGLLTEFWGISGVRLFDLEFNFGKQLAEMAKKIEPTNQA